MAEARARANDNINTIRNQTSVAYVNPPLSALDTVESEMKSRQNKREHVTKQTYTTIPRSRAVPDLSAQVLEIYKYIEIFAFLSLGFLADPPIYLRPDTYDLNDPSKKHSR